MTEAADPQFAGRVRASFARQPLTIVQADVFASANGDERRIATMSAPITTLRDRSDHPA